MVETEVRKGVRKQRVGIVVRDSAHKTAVVAVTRRYRHSLYGKEITSVKKYLVHDEKNESKAGDRVRIVETRPLSRLKRWRLAEVLARARGAAAGACAEEAGK